MTSRSVAGPSEVVHPFECDIGSAQLDIETLRFSCEILDAFPDSLQDDAFWEVAGRHFVGLVVRLEPFDGASLWHVTVRELESLRQASVDRLNQPQAEKTLGEYLFAEQTFLDRLLNHLITYARRRQSGLH